MVRKKGTIVILAVFITLTIFLLFYISIYFLFMQVNSGIFKIKQDIYYIAQDMIICFDKERLSLYDYKTSNKDLHYYFETLLKANNNNVNLENIEYNMLTNTLYVEVRVKVKPIFFSEIIKTKEINLKESVKLKIMEVKNE